MTIITYLKVSVGKNPNNECFKSRSSKGLVLTKKLSYTIINWNSEIMDQIKISNFV